MKREQMLEYALRQMLMLHQDLLESNRLSSLTFQNYSRLATAPTLARKLLPEGLEYCDGFCGRHLGEPGFDMVIVQKDLWDSIASPRDLLCHRCIEEALGRKLNADDFPDKLVPVYNNGQKLNLRMIPCNRDFFLKHGITFKKRRTKHGKRK